MATGFASGPTRNAVEPIDTGINLKGLLDELMGGYRAGQAERADAREGGIASLKEAIGLFDESYGKGQERRALADYNQNLVGRGLSGSTRGAAVSAGMKSEFEDIRRGRLGDALTRLAQFLSSFQSNAPTAGTVSHLATGGFSGLTDAARYEQSRLDQDAALNPGSGFAAGTPGGGLARDPFSTFGQGPTYGGGSTGAAGTGGFQSGGGGSSGGTSGTGGKGGGAWGDTSYQISQQQGQQARAPLTFSGMYSTYQQDYTPEPPTWQDWFGDPVDTPSLNLGGRVGSTSVGA